MTLTFNDLIKDIQIYCAVTLCFNDKNEILLASRRNSTTKFGMPGGKIEEGETPEECAIRETFEETGYRINALTPIILQKDDHDHICICYMAHIADPIDLPFGKGENDIITKWAKPEELLVNSPFTIFNKQVLKTINYIK